MLSWRGGKGRPSCRRAPTRAAPSSDGALPRSPGTASTGSANHRQMPDRPGGGKRNSSVGARLSHLSAGDEHPITMMPFANEECLDIQGDSDRDLVVVESGVGDRKSTRLNSSHLGISYAVFCLKKKKKYNT